MVSLLLLTLSQDLAPPPLPPPVPMLEVVVKREGPNGGGWAGDSGPDPFESYITVSDSGCGLGARTSMPAEFTGTVWHVTGETLQRTGATITAKVTWQRVGERGRVVRDANPALSQVLTLVAGDRFVLEPAAITADPNECGHARLEAGVIERRPQPVSASGVSGGAGAQAGAGGRTTIRSGGMSRLRKEVRSVASPAPLALVPGPEVDVEIWLVDTRPDGSEQAVRQRVPAGGDRHGRFQFAFTTDMRDAGTAGVRIAGEIQSVRGAAPNTLRVRLDRRVSAPNAAGSGGVSMVQVVLADANEVVAIELPESRTKAGPLLPGHDFSLRLRLAPGK